MKKIVILLIALIVIIVGFLSGCTKQPTIENQLDDNEEPIWTRPLAPSWSSEPIDFLPRYIIWNFDDIRINDNDSLLAKWSRMTKIVTDYDGYVLWGFIPGRNDTYAYPPPLNLTYDPVQVTKFIENTSHPNVELVYHDWNHSFIMNPPWTYRSLDYQRNVMNHIIWTVRNNFGYDFNTFFGGGADASRNTTILLAERDIILYYAGEELTNEGGSAAGCKYLYYGLEEGQAYSPYSDYLQVYQAGSDYTETYPNLDALKKWFTSVYKNNSIIRMTVHPVRYNESDIENFTLFVDWIYAEHNIINVNLTDAIAIKESFRSIDSIEKLDRIRLARGASYTLTKNLDFNNDTSYENPSLKRNYITGAGWLPIDTALPFYGTFNGHGYTISHLFINRTTDYNGLFGRIYNVGSYSKVLVSNVSLFDVNISGNGYVGGLAGYLSAETDSSRTNIINCGVTGKINGSASYVGGFIGYARHNFSILNSFSYCVVHSSSNYVGGFIGRIQYGKARIENCYATGDVITTANTTGGFGGLLDIDYIENCYATGDVFGDYAFSVSVGGFVGQLVIGSNVTRCYATGAVIGKEYVGGFVGRLEDTGPLTNCYALGSVKASYRRSGGFIGMNARSSIINCYSIGYVVSITASGGFCGYVSGSDDSNYADIGNFFNNQTSGHVTSAGNAIGKNTIDMQTLSIFTSTDWDIADINTWNGETWYIDNGNDYPRQR